MNFNANAFKYLTIAFKLLLINHEKVTLTNKFNDIIFNKSLTPFHNNCHSYSEYEF